MLKVVEMLRRMRERSPKGPKPFALLYCTADRRRKTGGEIRTLQKAVLLSVDGPQVLVQPVGVRDIIRISIDLILRFNDQALA